MAKLEMIRPYVEKLLKEYCQTDNLVVSENGDIPFERGSARYFVRLIDSDPPFVRVFSPILSGVKKTPELLDKMNDLNVELNFARVLWVDDELIVSTELVAETLDKEELEHACAGIGYVADEWDDQLQAQFGGEVAFPKGSDGGTEEEAAV